MSDAENYSITSQTVKENWELLKPAYVRIQELLKDHDPEEDPESLYWKLNAVIFSEWSENYQNFVLEPVREGILEIFKEALEIEFEADSEEKQYYVIYYLLQYFFVGIEPADDEDHFRIDLELDEELGEDDRNLQLYSMYRALWRELKLADIAGEEFNEHNTDEYYEYELDSLTKFLSELWKQAKEITKVKAKATLIEGTGADGEVELD